MSILEKTGTVHLKSNVDKIVIKYENGTEQALEKGLVCFFADDCQSEDLKTIRLYPADLTSVEYHQITQAIAEAFQYHTFDF